MLSYETCLALGTLTGLGLAMWASSVPPPPLWEGLIVMALFFPTMRAMFYLVAATGNDATKASRASVLQCQYARSLGATLRRTFPAPVIELTIPALGEARLRFFAGRAGRWLRLQFKSPALERAPWLHLQGAKRFWLPTVAVGAKALPTPSPDRHWRYWQLPWRPADPIVESQGFCATLPATRQTLVLTSRPGHLLIRGDHDDDPDTDASVVCENMVRLAVAWVKAVQQTTGSPRV